MEGIWLGQWSWPAVSDAIVMKHKCPDCKFGSIPYVLYKLYDLFAKDYKNRF